MFGFMGVITLLLSATGLFTLVSLNIIKRMKKIGVRKVLGASVANIT
jgi:putative ABC transport system permease protein